MLVALVRARRQPTAPLGLGQLEAPCSAPSSPPRFAHDPRLLCLAANPFAIITEARTRAKIMEITTIVFVVAMVLGLTSGRVTLLGARGEYTRPLIIFGPLGRSIFGAASSLILRYWCLSRLIQRAYRLNRALPATFQMSGTSAPVILR